MIIQSYLNKGIPDYMEDYIIIKNFKDYNIRYKNHYCLCIIDGHGGDSTALFIKNNFCNILYNCLQKNYSISESIKITINSIEKTMINKKEKSGSTLCGMYISNKYIYLFNIGDSKMILYNDKFNIIFQSIEHNTYNKSEIKNIKEHMDNNYIINSNSEYSINLTRTIGDYDFKDIINSEFEFKIIKKSDVKYIILASDGFWDLSIKNMNAYVKKIIMSGSKYKMLLNKNIYHDNVSIILVYL